MAVDNACEQQVPVLTGAECTSFDPSNDDVYVAAGEEHTILKLALNTTSDEYEVVAELASSLGERISDIAVDDQGNVYVDE